MEKQRLVATLERMHRELSAADDVDPETLALLETLTGDIDRLLSKRQQATPSEVEPVSSGIRDLIRKFEADHPQLSATIGKVADALSAMGI